MELVASIYFTTSLYPCFLNFLLTLSPFSNRFLCVILTIIGQVCHAKRMACVYWGRWGQVDARLSSAQLFFGKVF